MADVTSAAHVRGLRVSSGVTPSSTVGTAGHFKDTEIHERMVLMEESKGGCKNQKNTKMTSFGKDDPCAPHPGMDRGEQPQIEDGIAKCDVWVLR